jgi:hypothetical protein
MSTAMDTSTPLEGVCEMVESVCSSNVGWKGEDTFGDWISYDKIKPAIQASGILHGCHSCLTKIVGDKDQAWIGDHIPPSRLWSSVRLMTEIYSIRNFDRPLLFPQCDRCASQQPSIVAKLLQRRNGPSMTVADLTEKERTLVASSNKKVAELGFIAASNIRVNEAEGKKIQVLGIEHGCHSCDSRVASSIYHADHVIPSALFKPQVLTLMQSQPDLLKTIQKINPWYPKKGLFRPQCRRCSNAQGSDVQHLLLNIAQLFGK